jgi:single-strand DNA-binding protein
MNLSIFTGNIGRDPELRQFNGDNILNFSIGVQTGNREKPETMWVDCALWGKRATSLQPYLAKGMRVTVSGAVKLEAFTAKDGTPKTSLRMSVDQIDLPPKGDAPAQKQQTQQTQQPAGDMADMDDDIPF